MTAGQHKTSKIRSLRGGQQRQIHIEKSPPMIRQLVQRPLQYRTCTSRLFSIKDWRLLPGFCVNRRHRPTIVPCPVSSSAARRASDLVFGNTTFCDGTVLGSLDAILWSRTLCLWSLGPRSRGLCPRSRSTVKDTKLTIKDTKLTIKGTCSRSGALCPGSRGLCPRSGALCPQSRGLCSRSGGTRLTVKRTMLPLHRCHHRVGTGVNRLLHPIVRFLGWLRHDLHSFVLSLR